MRRCAAQMRVERARQLLDAGADRLGSNEALQLEIMIRETTRVIIRCVLWPLDGRTGRLLRRTPNQSCALVHVGCS